MTKPISNDELERIRAVAVAGRKIEAIRLYRAATGAGLAEAKQAVKALEAGRTIDIASKGAMSNDAADQNVPSIVDRAKRIVQQSWPHCSGVFWGVGYTACNKARAKNGQAVSLFLRR